MNRNTSMWAHGHSVEFMGKGIADLYFRLMRQKPRNQFV
jgi:hypothetical protein